MTLFRRRWVIGLRRFEIRFNGRLEIPPHLALRTRLILLHRQHVIAALFLDPRRNCSLACQPIVRHDTLRQSQHLRYRRDVAGLLIRVHLSKRDATSRHPGADHAQGPCTALAIMRTPMGLTVLLDHLAVTEVHHIFHRAHEATLNPTHRQCEHDAYNGVIHHDPIGPRNIPAKPLRLRAPELLSVTSSLGSTDHRQHAQHDDINQGMRLVPN